MYRTLVADDDFLVRSYLKTLDLSQVSFPLDFPLCYIFPYGFMDSDKGKYKGAGHPVDVRFAPTVAKRRSKKLYKTV